MALELPPLIGGRGAAPGPTYDVCRDDIGAGAGGKRNFIRITSVFSSPSTPACCPSRAQARPALYLHVTRMRGKMLSVPACYQNERNNACLLYTSDAADES